MKRKENKGFKEGRWASDPQKAQRKGKQSPSKKSLALELFPEKKKAKASLTAHQNSFIKRSVNLPSYLLCELLG